MTPAQSGAKWRSSAKGKAWIAKFRNSKIREWIKNHPIDDLRCAAIHELGGRCVRCDYTDLRALQIDHVNGNGAAMRRKVTNRVMYKAILAGKPHTEYQILCANCNWIKRHEEGLTGGRKPRIYEAA